MISAITISAITCWFILYFLIPQLRLHLLDQPNARSSHAHPTPRGGGVVFVVISSVSSFIALIIGQGLGASLLPLLALPLAIVGLIDDRYNLPALWRYGFQLLTAFVIVAFSPVVQFSNPILLIAAISVTAIINFTNFMDGIDGLVSGCMAISITSLAIALHAQWPIWSLAGSLLGFLFWNWSPAKVFMGDVGSTFLGAVFAGLVLQAPSLHELFGYLLVATPLLADACLCVPRRLLSGQRVFKAHRLHLFQRLHQAGWSHERVSFIYVVATAGLGVSLLCGGWKWVLCLAVVELSLGIWLDQCVAIPFSIAARK